MRKLTLVSIVAAVAVLTLAVMAVSVSANPDNSRNRVMNMEGVGAFEESSAHVNLISYYDDNSNPHFETSHQIWYAVKNLPCTTRISNDGEYLMYTLWVETDTNGTLRLENFNTKCSGQTFGNEVVDPDGGQLDTILDETVHLWVTVERDGGVGGIDGTLVMEGTLEQG
jgi:hypothetical protein